MSEKVFGSEKKGSLRDIPLPKNKELNLSDADTSSSLQQGATGEHNESSSIPLGIDGRDWDQVVHRSPRVPLIMLGVFLLMGGIIFLYSLFSHHATVSLSTRIVQEVITGTYEATHSEQELDTLQFIALTPIEAELSVHVAGSKEENRQIKTQGTLRVFNTGSSEKRYVNKTRFETADGRVYRAFNRFVIPERSSDDPGSSEVLVVAEHPGEKYNASDGLTFTLPALKEQGSPAFDEVYAEQAGPLSGGYSGIVTVPDESDMKAARTALESDLKQAVYQELSTRSQDLLVDNNLTQLTDIEFTETVNKSKGGIDISGKVSLLALGFDLQKFKNFLARTYVKDYDGSDVEITNFKDITIDFPILKEVEGVESFELKIVGEAQFVHSIDKPQIAKLLAGKLVSHVENDLISGLDNVEVLSVKVDPPWRGSLPDNSEKISINIE